MAILFFMDALGASTVVSLVRVSTDPAVYHSLTRCLKLNRIQTSVVA
jgi:hypothetical protein